MQPYSFKKNLTFFLSIISILATILIPTPCHADADKIYKENEKAVVVVVVYDGEGRAIRQGSGFIVREGGVIVTNHHVISNARSIKIKTGSKVFNVEGIINLDKENDIAILKVDANNLPTVTIGDADKSSIGEKVYVISSPQGLENTVSDGILSGKREIAPNIKILQMTASVSSGSSGGAVFNENGEVIGIATLLLKDSQNLNFAIPVNVIKGKISGEKLTAIGESQIDDYENTAEYWFYRGVAYGELGMYREMIEANKRAIQIKPDMAEAYNNLGVAYDGSGMYREAIEAQKQAIQIKPDFAKALYNLGLVYGRLSIYPEAVATFKQAIRIKPEYAEAYYALGIVYVKLGMYREAIEPFRQATRIQPDVAGAYYNLGMAYLALHDKNSALREYGILKNLDPQKANQLLNFIYK
jgi:Flp pilus assembly protein TadD